MQVTARERVGSGAQNLYLNARSWIIKYVYSCHANRSFSNGNEVLIDAMTWMNCDSVISSDRVWTQGRTDMIPLTGNTQEPCQPGVGKGDVSHGLPWLVGRLPGEFSEKQQKEFIVQSNLSTASKETAATPSPNCDSLSRGNGCLYFRGGCGIKCQMGSGRRSL